MPLADLQLDERFQQSYELITTVPVNDPKGSWVEVDEMMEFNGEKFFVTEIVGSREEEHGDFEITAEASWMRLTDFKRPGTYTLNATPANGLNNILFGTGWTAISVTADATLYTLETQDISVLDWLWQWAEKCGCEITFETSSKTLVFQPTVGAFKAPGFRYGRNMKSIRRTVTAPQATRIYPYGKSDETTVVTLSGGAEYVEDYTYYIAQGMSEEDARANYRKDEVFNDETVTDSATLYNLAMRRLAILSRPVVKYEVDVVDLSRITGLPEMEYRVGDTVPIYDELLNIDTTARVTRTVKFPNSPEKNKLELTFGGILQQSQASSARSGRSREWELFESNNRVTPRLIGAGTTILNRLAMTSTSGTEWVIGYSFHGVGVGTGTLILEPTNDDDAQPLWPPVSFDFVDGQEINWHFSYAEDEVPAAEPVCVVRAYTTGGGTVAVPERGTQFWILARGSTQRSPSLANSIRYDHNTGSDGTSGSVRQFTVPDDVTEIQVECVGARGRGSAGPTQGGKGGKVIAKFSVLGGAVYDVYVGGSPGQPGASSNYFFGGWPNGGDGGNYNARGGGGGGATFLVPTGGTIATAIIVAGGGGGAGAGPSTGVGGDAGFYAGLQGGDTAIGQGGKGATSTAPGAGGDNLFFGVPNGSDGEAGDVDGQGQGGDSLTNPGIITGGLGSGGGGGGFHGGGGGGNQAGGGGGGSGTVSGGWDIEFEDAYNEEFGYMVISWDEVDET